MIYGGHFDKDSKEKRIQETIIEIKKRYGKNAILKGMNLEEKATTRKRNKLIGGHNGEWKSKTVSSIWYIKRF